MTTDPFARLDTAIGPVAAMSLEQRRLLPPTDVDLAGGTSVPADVDDERRRAVLDGAALGALVGVPLAGADPDRAPGSLARGLARARRRPGTPAEVEVLALTIDAVVDGPDLGGEGLAQRLLRFRPRRASRAFVATIEALQAGTPWFEAGPPSLGSSCVPRAAAHALVLGADPAWRAVATTVDTAVTHAHPEATATAALAAEAIAWALVQDPGDLDPDALVEHLAERSWDPVLAAALRRLPAATTDPAPLATTVLGSDATAHRALLTAVLGLLRGDGDPEPSVLATLDLGGDVAPAATLAGAILGAAHGPAWIEPHADALRGAARTLDEAADALGLPGGRRTSKGGGRRRPGAITGSTSDELPTGEDGGHVHIGFLLDRSGSMGAIASDVVGGFNAFLAQQLAVGRDDCDLTLVQFDGDDPFQVITQGTPLADVPELTGAIYVPRGMTPLYDALDAMIDDAERHVAARVRAGQPAGDVVIVVFTDGLENASVRATREQVMDRIKAKQDDDDWTFVFMGANQDAYGASHEVGIAAGSTSGWHATERGAMAAYDVLSSSMSVYRRGSAAERRSAKEDFFRGDKSAEDPDVR